MSYPNDFKCPISLKLLKDPVICDDGITYEREEITKWFLEPASVSPFDPTKRISPMTKILISTNLIPNFALRNSIEEYLRENKIHDDQEVNDNIDEKNIQIENKSVLPVPAPIIAEAVQNIENNFDIKCDGVDRTGRDVELHLALIPPNSGTKRNTVYINVVDVSGSMQLPAMSDSKEGDFEYSRLDLVKYSLQNIVENCDDEDYFALVTFSNNAEEVMGITRMTKDGKELAIKKIYEQETKGATNLWAGMLAGLELAKKRICQENNVSMIVLTDGEANENPPRGVYATLETYLEKNQISCSINILGFGYDIDSNLLYDIALKLGNGTFCFIPDCTMIGTNVTSLIAKNKTCYAKEAKLVLTLDGAQWKSSSDNYIDSLNLDTSLYEKKGLTKKDSMQTLIFGPIEYGQRFNLMLRLKDVKHNACVKVELYYNLCNVLKTEIKEFFVNNINDRDEDVINESLERKHFVRCIFDLIKIRQNTEQENKKQKAIEKLVKELLKINKNEKYSREFDIKHDKEGQVAKAVSTPEWFKKWGLSHCLYLISSHLRRFNANFKDPSIQNYGGNIFEQNRTDCENIFCTLQPPKPSIQTNNDNNNYNYQSNNRMAQVCCNYDAGCFTGDSEIVMKSGCIKKVNELMPGDELQSWNGKTAKIKCILKTRCLKPIKIVKLNGLKITPYHPVWIENKWQFPISLEKSSTISCDFVYNLVVDEQHVVIINGINCVTLGHGYNHNEIIYHPYFGTNLVIDDLKEMRGWKEGLIRIDNILTTRDENTGLINKIIQGEIFDGVKMYKIKQPIEIESF
jgi:Mg-chelatase subunit ChlD